MSDSTTLKPHSQAPHRVDEAYWDARYGSGGTSGQGSIGWLRAWKWKRLRHWAGAIDDVVDVGCGDLSFWKPGPLRRTPNPASYVGVDASEVIIERNQRARPTWNFIRSSAGTPQPIQGRIVLCMDMLFHVGDDKEFDAITRNLARYAKEWLFVYTWLRSPWPDRDTDNRYMWYRSPRRMLETFWDSGLDLVAVERHPRGDIGGLFVLRRNTPKVKPTTP